MCVCVNERGSERRATPRFCMHELVVSSLLGFILNSVISFPFQTWSVVRPACRLSCTVLVLDTPPSNQVQIVPTLAIPSRTLAQPVSAFNSHCAPSQTVAGTRHLPMATAIAATRCLSTIHDTFPPLTLMPPDVGFRLS
jgi:hypothetical protein